MIKKFVSLCVVGIMVLSFEPGKSEAGLLDGISLPLPVRDDTSIVQQVTAVKHAWDQIQNQLNMLKNQALHLLRIDSDGVLRDRTQIGKNLEDLAKISHPTAKGSVALEYEILEKQWNEEYDITLISRPSNKTSVHDYANKVLQLTQATTIATGNAMKAQGFVSQIDKKRKDTNESEREMLDRLVAQSGGTSGTLAAAQTGNEIAALQTSQLMRLQYLIAGNQSSQATLQAQEIVKRNMAIEAVKRFYASEISSGEYKSNAGGRLKGLTD